MGKKPAARQPSPMWVTTADLPTSAGHPFFERLNRVLEEAGFDAFVEGLCAVFYASRLGRPSLRPGRYFRLLFIGYFEGLSSERGIAWRVADSLSLRAFLDLDVTEAPPNHSTLSRTRRLIDLETGAILSVTVQEASEGDSATLPATLTMAAEQVEAVQPAGAEVEEVVADKGYHSDATLVALDEIGVRSYVSEPERGRRCWQDKKTGETPAEKRAAQKATIWEPSAYSRRPRSSSSTPPRGAGGAAFRAPVRDRGAAAGVGARPRECAQAGAHPGGRLQPRTAAAPADRRRHAPEPAGAGSFGHLRTDRSPDRALGASDGLLGLPMDAGGAGRLNRSSPSCLNRPAQRTAFFHGLLTKTIQGRGSRGGERCGCHGVRPRLRRPRRSNPPRSSATSPELDAGGAFGPARRQRRLLGH